MLRTAIPALITSLVFAVNANAGCTEDQAYNKMMAFNRVAQRSINSKKPEVLQQGIKLTTDSAPLGQLLADKKFDQACAEYDKLGAKYKIDWAKESEGLITMEELKKDGGKRGGECSQADAHIKMMKMHGEIEDLVRLGGADASLFGKFSADTGNFADLMFTSPSEVCKQLRALRPKYGLK